MGSKSSRSRRYTEEFKRDAVALVRSSGRTVTEVARELGVGPEGLRNWVRQDQVDRGQGAPGRLTAQTPGPDPPGEEGGARGRPARPRLHRPGPGMRLVGDITFIATGEGLLYPAT
ncbi:transposase [Streptomyces sp. P9-A2]|uniref:transposase n=1 Tax=Streptomyces sp. P9-A2 TaxID=3072284 RepID=UPI002FC985D6